ncbi:signal-transducing adaptor protein 2b isoform X2 [Sinocyclocheilus rhinocerous]|uniref:signal-transducing adaptor protein 2b isoform X2 n=1 Tax=Sinocyclocheilus rhinocerous TaxID=307959 RepID=UPI0007B90A05|nr:PREDICTED: signal-transducing adaptor protein 1-like isoform X2 [Sinocyclocheilus rhinocerous]
MAAANRFKRVRSQLPSCYYDGFLEKKSIKDKMGHKLWTSLCGNSLFFYNSTKDSVYIEKLELSDLVSVSDDCCRHRNLDAARFTLHMKNEDIKMIAPSLEARELWKGFMLSVSKLSVPSSLNLLPGQIHMMKEIIEKEKIRQRLLSSLPPPSCSDNCVTVPSDMPSCYHNVTRVEAEYLLERNANRGSLLLRPGHDGASFALTTRQDINGPVFRHYRVSRRHEGGFAIALETPITCETLHDVVNCLLEKTNGVLVPLLMEGHYDKNITFAETDNENGERSLHCPKVPSPTPPVPPPKPAFAETNNENGETIVQCPKVPSPTPPVPPPKPVPNNQRSSSEPNTYINVSNAGEYEVDQAACSPPPVLPRLPGRYLPHQNSMPPDLNSSSDVERKPLVPSGYPKTSSRSNSLSGIPKNIPKCQQQHVDINELQEVLNRRRNQE